MKVSRLNDSFIIQSTFAEKEIAKAAAAAWHPKPCFRPKCFACTRGIPTGTWWTTEIGTVARLKEYCDPDILPLIEQYQQHLSSSKASKADVNIPAPPGLDYLPFQKAGISYIIERVSKATAPPGVRGVLVGDSMGLGKGQPIDSLVMTPGGWRKIGDLKVGSVISTPGGGATYVTGVFHRGTLPVYRVVFSDGASLLVDGDHLWSVRTSIRQEPQVLDTRTIAKNLGAKFFIPQISPTYHPHADLPIDPYLLGVLLGDGHLATARHAAHFTCGDESVPMEVRKVLPPGVYLNKIVFPRKADSWHIVSPGRSSPNPVLDAMRELGLAGVEAQERFIPHQYLWGSVEQRLALLRGLMDTDGEYSKGLLQFSSASLQLVSGVMELIESVGGTARYRLRAITGYKDKHGKFIRCKPSHKLTINMPLGISPFRARKGYVDKPNPPRRTITNIQRSGTAEVVCISVASYDKLYVTERHIVTHNTIQALGTCNALPEIGSVLVVCPASLRLNWLKEATKWLIGTWKFHVVMDSTPIPADATFVIVNYERIWREDTKPQLVDRTWGLVVADESHRARNYKAKQTQALIGVKGDPGLFDRAERILCLTGTPMPNRTIEMWTTIHALDPAMWQYWGGFAKRYCAGYKENIRGRSIWNVDGSSHTEELQEKLRSRIMLRRLKEDVLPELPKKRHQIIPLAPNGAGELIRLERDTCERLEELEDELQFADDEEREELEEELQSARKVAFKDISRIRAELAVSKIPIAIQHIEDTLDSGVKKLIVFGHHLALLNAVYEKFKERAVILTGETPMKDRQDAVDLFQNDSRIDLFVGSITAAGVGITLTAADLMDFLEITWVPSDMDQARDRIVRIGATAESVLFRYLLYDGSLDVRMLQVANEKQAVITKTLDGSTEIVLPQAQPEKPKRVWPVAPEYFRTAVVTGLRRLNRMCDGAVSEDEVGFNRMDSRWGKRLAEKTTMRELSDGEVWYAARRIWKYSTRQLPDLKEALSLWLQKTESEKPEKSGGRSVKIDDKKAELVKAEAALDEYRKTENEKWDEYNKAGHAAEEIKNKLANEVSDAEREILKAARVKEFPTSTSSFISLTWHPDLIKAIETQLGVKYDERHKLRKTKYASDPFDAILMATQAKTLKEHEAELAPLNKAADEAASRAHLIWTEQWRHQRVGTNLQAEVEKLKREIRRLEESSSKTEAGKKKRAEKKTKDEARTKAEAIAKGDIKIEW